MISGTVEVGDANMQPQVIVTMVEVQPSKCCEPENCGCCRDENKGRGNWSHPIESRLASVGFATGIMALTRLPNMMYSNGGASFLVPYFVAWLLLVVPFIFLEMSLGQFTSSGVLTCWEMIPFFKGLGVLILLLSTYLAVEYGVLLTYTVRFLGETLHSARTGLDLPWVDCHRNWNTAYCKKWGNEELVLANDSSVVENSTYHTATPAASHYKTPAEDFLADVIGKGFTSFKESVAEEDTMDDLLNYNLIGLSAVWLLVAVVLILGCKSLGKVSYITTPLSFILVIVLLTRCITLPGAMDGVRYMLSPNWNSILTTSAWKYAMQLAILDYGLALGGYLTLASYNKFHQAFIADAFLVAAFGFGMCMLSGMTLFCLFGYMASEQNVDVATIVTTGPQALFVTIPTALSNLTMPHVWVSLFFLLVLVVGLGFMFGCVEVVITAFVDQISVSRRFRPIVTVSVCMVGMALGIPFMLKKGPLLIHIVETALPLPTYSAAFILGICFAWYGFTEYHLFVYKDDLGLMAGRTCGVVMFYIWSLLFAFGLIMCAVSIYFWVAEVVVQGIFNDLTTALMIAGWCLTAVPLGVMLLVAILVVIVKAITEKKRSETAFIPSKRWGPRLYWHRKLMLRYWSSSHIELGPGDDGDEETKAQMLPEAHLVTEVTPPSQNKRSSAPLVTPDPDSDEKRLL